MTLPERIAALTQLGERLQQPDDYLDALMQRTAYHNAWLTVENQRLALEAITEHLLHPGHLSAWVSQYDIPHAARGHQLRVGIVMAGNIPLVGFHDWLCIFVAGHQSVVKLSDKDPYLFPYLLRLLEQIDARTATYTQLQAQLAGFDAVIATGSNNSARYFEAYFGRYPHIIRRNRNGVAVLTGTETADELYQLGQDVFRYFGLGCRNVAHLFVPPDYDFDPLLTALHEYRELVRHTAYKNNFDYNYALFILNRVPIHANGCILITENTALQSHIAGLYYSAYADVPSLQQKLRQRADDIQVIVARPGLLDLPTVPFGQAQEPGLSDYADGVDTLAFLLGLEVSE